MEKKQDIRTRILSLRDQLPEEARQAKSDCICKAVVGHELFLAAKTIYCYVSFRSEVDTQAIIRHAWRAGKKVAVPKVTGNHEMCFYYIDSMADLKPGFFQVPEPVTGTVAKESDALVIMPGAAFDQKGGRIGYGKGFYDYYLTENPGQPRMGLAFALQVLDVIPSDAHDVKVQMLATEKGMITC